MLDYNKHTLGYVREDNLRARKEVQSMINTLELVDIWRANNPQKQKVHMGKFKKTNKNGQTRFFPHILRYSCANHKLFQFIRIQK